MSNTREPGYYWVKDKYDGWQIAIWHKDLNEWDCPLYTPGINEDKWEEIDERRIERMEPLVNIDRIVILNNGHKLKVGEKAVLICHICGSKHTIRM